MLSKKIWLMYNIDRVQIKCHISVFEVELVNFSKEKCPILKATWELLRHG